MPDFINEFKIELSKLQDNAEFKSMTVESSNPALIGQVKKTIKKIITTLDYYNKAREKASKYDVYYPIESESESPSYVMENLLIFTRAVNEDRMIIDYRDYLKDLSKFKKIIDLFILYVNKEVRGIRHKKNGSPDEVVDIYAQSKNLFDEIYRDYNAIAVRLSKVKVQQERIDQLERKYRDALLQIDIDENEYLSKKSILDKGAEIANEFLPRVSDISNNLDILKSNTENSIVDVTRLVTFVQKHNKEYENKVSELDAITLKAKEVLGNATAAAVGEHFKSQYDLAKKWILLWPVLGAVFLLSAISICLLTVFPEVYVKIFGGDIKTHTFTGDNIPYVISRILVAPLFLAGAWFCASQYIKQKNIVEDYAYKKVLSLSLLSIKSEIEKTGEKNTSAFIKAIQKEILKSPLDSLDRKHFGKEMKLLGEVQSQILINLADQLSRKDKKPDKKENEG